MKSGWRRLAFDDVLADESAGNIKTPQSEFLSEGRFAIVDQGKDLVAGYGDDESRVCRAQLPVIVFGDHTRCFKFVDFPFCMGADGVKVLRPKFDADVRFLYHQLRSVRLTNAGYDRHFKHLKRAHLVLPPVVEQRRIAEVLDRAEALRAKRRAALDQLDLLTQAIFFDMFGDPATIPARWPRAPLGDLLESIESGWSPPCLDRPVTESEWGVLKLGAVTWCEYDETENKALPPGIEPDASIEVRPGDVLFVRKNTRDLVAACVLVEETRPKLMMSDLIFRLRLRSDSGIDPAFLHQLLIYPTKRRAIQTIAGGSAGSMPNISKARLRSVEIELPPLLLQRKFAERVDAVRNLKRSHRASLAELDALFASLQHQAFRGEL